MARRRRRNPWITTSEVLVWVLFVALLFPAAFAGWAVGHYTSLGGGKTKTVTVSAGGTSGTTTTAAASTSTAATSTAASTTTSASSTSSTLLTAGHNVYQQNGCGSCHTFAPANSTGSVGPNLDTAPAADAKKDNMALAPFVKQSITDPNAYVAPGFPKGVMPSTFGSSLSAAQLNALVAFVVSGAK